MVVLHAVNFLNFMNFCHLHAIARKHVGIIRTHVNYEFAFQCCCLVSAVNVVCASPGEQILCQNFAPCFVGNRLITGSSLVKFVSVLSKSAFHVKLGITCLRLSGVKGTVLGYPDFGVARLCI